MPELNTDCELLSCCLGRSSINSTCKSIFFCYFLKILIILKTFFLSCSLQFVNSFEFSTLTCHHYVNLMSTWLRSSSILTLFNNDPKVFTPTTWLSNHDPDLGIIVLSFSKKINFFGAINLRIRWKIYQENNVYLLLQ